MIGSNSTDRHNFLSSQRIFDKPRFIRGRVKEIIVHGTFETSCVLKIIIDSECESRFSMGEKITERNFEIRNVAL